MLYSVKRFTLQWLGGIKLARDRLSEGTATLLLLDFYGELLSPRQQELLTLYYEEDLSLSEIAATAGISRQGALESIRKGEAILKDTEAKLGLAARFGKERNSVEAIIEGLRSIKEGKTVDIDKLIELTESLL